MLWATLLLPVPGGPARQRIVAGWSAACPAAPSGRPARVGPHAAHGQILEDAVLDVLEAEVRALEVPRHPGDVHVRRRQPAPGQIEHGVEEPADDGDLRTHGRRLPELGELAGDELARRRREIGLGGALHVPGDVVVGGLAALLDLVAQHAQLLVQQELALRALDALLHLEADLLLDAEHGVLLGEALEQGEEALLRADDLQQRLLLRGLRLQVCGDDVGELVRVVGLLHHELRLVGELRVHLDVAHELVGDAAREAARARRPRVRALHRRVLHDEVRLAGDHAQGAHALVALDQRLDAAVRQLEELEHPGAHPDGTQVLERGVLDGRLALGAQDERALPAEGRLDGGDGLLPPDEDGRDHLGEQDEVASRQEGQGRRGRALPLLSRHALFRRIRRHAPAATCPPR